MKIAITDANIFIDLIKLQMLPFLFAVELEITTSLEVIEELYESQQQELQHFVDLGQLSLHIFSVEEWKEIENLEIPRGLTLEDITIAYLAAKKQAIVVTGDNPLRKYCTQQQLETRGILWLFDTFLKYRHINKLQAKEKLIILRSYNQRLPVKECEQRLKQWNDDKD
jgi:predicted nucleic acid-binding protein